MTGTVGMGYREGCRGKRIMSQKNYVLFAVMTASFSMPFMASSINVAVPAIAYDFGVEAVRLSWVVTAYLLGSSCLLLPMGRLADIAGRKRLFRMGITAVVLATLGAGLSFSAEMLILFRFLQGMAISLVFSTSTALLVAAYPPSERGRGIGLSTSAVYLGLSLGPFLGGMITQYLGWRVIFFLMTVLLCLCRMTLRRIEGEWYGDKGKQLDYTGSLIYAIGILCMLYGLSCCATEPWGVSLLVIGFLLLLAFLWRQKKAESPLLELSLFRNTVFTMSNLAALLQYSSVFAISFLMSLYLQLIHGMDEMTAGLILLSQPVIMVILSPQAGMLSDRYQPRWVASTGMLLTALGLFLLSCLEMEAPLWHVVGALVVCGAGVAFFSSPNGNAIMGSVESRQLGIAASVMSLTRVSGQAVSMAIVTIFLHSNVLPETDPGYLESLYREIVQLFQFFVVLCCVGAWVSLMRGNRALIEK